MLTIKSINSPYVRAILRKMREKKIATLEKITSNLHLIIFDFDDFMETLCEIYDENKKFKRI